MEMLKKTVTWIMILALGISCCACEKSKKKKEESVKEEIDYYRVCEQEDFDYVIGYTVVIDNVIYGYYIRDIYAQTGETSYGLFQYDLDTKKKAEIALDSEIEQIKGMYVNEDGNFVINAKMHESEDSDKKYIVTYVYNHNFEQISKNENNEYTASDESDSEVEEPEIYLCGDNMVKLVELAGDEYEIRLEDKAGNIMKRISVTNMYIQDFVKLSEDTFVILGMVDGGYKLYRTAFEEENLTELPDWKSVDASIYPRTEDTLLVNTDGYLTIFDIATGKTTRVLKYLDSSIDSRKVQMVYEIDEDSYAVLIYDFETEQSALKLLTKRDIVSQKQEIHIATMLPGQKLEQKVMEFNQLNDKYRLVIDDYGEAALMQSHEEFEDSKRQFNLDIATGNGADIIDVGFYIDIKEYASKGIFEDLLPYIEQDNEINEEDFMENIVNAFKTDGKLYALSPDVEISAIAGNKDRLGDSLSWTLEEFEEYVRNLPQEMDIFPRITGDELLKEILMDNLDEFIDWESGKCHFNSDEFIQLLELCGTYKTYEEYFAEHEQLDDWGDIPSDISQIKMNMADLYRCGISPESYVAVKELYGENLTIKGYPTVEGNGIIIGLDDDLTFAINSKSKYKDVAWEFLRQFYTYEGQTELHSTPIRKDAYEKKLNDVMNSEMKTAPDGTKYFTGCNYGDITLYYPKPTEEEIQYVRELVSMADTVSENYGIELFDIIEEEAESYFMGQKSSGQVAELIQSRVSVYVSEKS